MTTREEILSASAKADTEVVDVGEWGPGLKLSVRGLTGAERWDYDQSMFLIDQKGRMKVGPLRNRYAELVVRCVVDDEGNRVFRDSDAAALGKKPGAALMRLYEVASRLSGMSEEQKEDEAEAFEPAQPGDSSTE